LIAVTDENGTVVERYAYDPWGARRNPDNWDFAGKPCMLDIIPINMPIEKIPNMRTVR
jgi:hypothetical protein